MIDDSVAERPRRVVVGVDGSLGSMQALRRAVAEASVLAWTPPGGEGAYRRSPPCPLLLDEWRAEHARRLKTTWNEALGGVPEDLTVHLLVIRGDAGRVLVELADRVDDLLVVGAGRRRPLRRLLCASTVRYCVASARCCTVTVSPSSLDQELGGGVLRRRLAQRRMARILFDGDGPGVRQQRATWLRQDRRRP